MLVQSERGNNQFSPFESTPPPLPHHCRTKSSPAFSFLASHWRLQTRGSPLHTFRPLCSTKKSNICLKNVKRNRLGRNSAAFCYFLQLRWVFYANRTRAACLFGLTATKCEQLGRYSREFLFFSLALPIFSFHVFTFLFLRKEVAITRLYMGLYDPNRFCPFFRT